MGRNDDQVKIRGYRIELREIENVLKSIKGIQQSCVVVKERSTDLNRVKYIVGYYVLDEIYPQEEIYNSLVHILPAYMVPDYLVRLDNLPLNVSGKIDRSSLPEPDLGKLSEEYMAPVTGLEKLLCRIWQEVLGIEVVGTRDNFFKLGGNSILAIHASHRMNKAMGREVFVADLFRYKTISDLINYCQSQDHFLIGRVDEERVGLSFSQERLWFIEQYEEGTNAYHIPVVYEVEETASTEGIKYALQKLVFRHEVFRSKISQEEGEVHGFQWVDNASLDIEELALNEQDLDVVLREDINRPFDLRKQYPIRVKFYRVQSDGKLSRILILINIHHIAGDGWSMDIFQRELKAYYEAYERGDYSFDLDVLNIQYRDYAAWQRNYLRGEILDKQLSYWKEKLSGFQALELPTDYSRPVKTIYSGAQHRQKLSRELSKGLKDLAQKNGITVHSIMLGGTGILLSKYTGQDDILIGSPIANRHHHQTSSLIGFFVNTQVNRLRLNQGESFEFFIQAVYDDQVETQFHQDLPFEKLVDELGGERDTSRHPVFQVMFGVQSFGKQLNVVNGKRDFLREVEIDGLYKVEKFDLSIFVDDGYDEFDVSINYATSLFKDSTIGRLMDHYIYLLERLVADPQINYSELSLLREADYNRIVYEWNKTDKTYPDQATVHSLFEEQVLKTPDNIAIVYGDQHLTYRELNERSNQVARHIRFVYEDRTGSFLDADTLVGICVERSLEMIVGILGILKSGGAYVPIDPECPRERCAYILENTGAVIVLTSTSLSLENEKKFGGDKLLNIDLGSEVYNKYPTENLEFSFKNTSLAYVIYTSGTTGNPKGVMLEHKGVVNRIEHIVEYSSVSCNDYHLFKTNYVFDASFFELFVHFLVGAKVHITKELFNIEEIVSLLARKNITSIHLVPSQYYLISSSLLSNNLQKIYFSVL